jgi:hypothetical protein
MAWIKQHKLILLILLVATVLRFWAFWEIPYSHDELSALLRTQFSTWSDFIETGIKMDNHPGGVQLLIWWQTMIGGYKAYWIKLPFLMSGVWCVWMIYLVGRRMFSESVGLTSAALLASLQFPITFSQWARPYVIGLLVVLALTWVLLRLIQSEKRSWLWIAGYAMLCALAGYVHYFTLLQVIIISCAFIPYLNRGQLFKLTLGGLLAFVLWLPHLGLTLFHLDRGGIGNWLSAPESDYWLEIIAYVFQFSVWVPLLLVVVSISKLLDVKQWWKVYSRYFLLICAATPYMIGYVYSVQVNPLLHQSVLIFSMPFLLLFCASFVTDKRPILDGVVILILAINVNVLITDRNHFEVNYQSEYVSPMRWLHEMNASHAMIPALLELREDFTEMMFKENIVPTHEVQYAEALMASDGLDEYLSDLDSDHLFFAMNSGSDPELFATVLDHFPCIDSVQYYHAGEAYLLNRDCDSRKLLARETEPQKLDALNPYSKSVEVVVDDPTHAVNIHAVAEFAGKARDASLVMDVKSESNPSWRGVSLNHSGGSEGHLKAFNVYYFSEWELSVNDQIKSFVWLNSDDSLSVTRLSLYSVPSNSNKFKLFKP